MLKYNAIIWRELGGIGRATWTGREAFRVENEDLKQALLEILGTFDMLDDGSLRFNGDILLEDAQGRPLYVDMQGYVRHGEGPCYMRDRDGKRLKRAKRKGRPEAAGDEAEGSIVASINDLGEQYRSLFI